jgi:hypothetical protein
MQASAFGFAQRNRSREAESALAGETQHYVITVDAMPEQLHKVLSLRPFPCTGQETILSCEGALDRARKVCVGS